MEVYGKADQVQSEVKPNLKSRARELDIIRGLFILLMIYGHFLDFVLTFNFFWWDGASESALAPLIDFASATWSWQGLMPLAHISLFFFYLVSGISSTFTKNKTIRFLKLLILATSLAVARILVYHFTGLNFSNYVFEFQGYALAALIFLLISKIKGKGFFIAAGIIILLSCLTLIFTREFWGNHVHPVRLAAFMAGTILGKTWYSDRKSKLSFLDNLKHEPVSFVGRNSLWFWIGHIFGLPLVVWALGVIFI